MALQVVGSEDEHGGAQTAADLIAAALERRRAAAALPLTHHDEETGVAFTYRRLSGAEVRQCRAKATVGMGTAQQRVDQDRMEFAIVNLASVEPKVTQVVWAQLGELGPLVQASLSAAVFQACGLIAEPVADAKNDSSEIQS